MVVKAIKETASSIYCKVDWTLKSDWRKLEAHIKELLANFDYKISYGASQLVYEMHSQIIKLPAERQEWIKKFLDAGHDFETALKITSYPIAE